MKKYFTGSLIVLWLVVCLWAGPVAGTFGSILAFGGAMDFGERIIPNRVCVAVALLGAGEILTGPREQVKWKVFSILIVMLILILLRLVLKEGIGLGDIKLLMACSFSLGVFSLMMGMSLACVVAAVGGIFTTKSLRGEVPLGPFLAVFMTVMKIAETM